MSKPRVLVVDDEARMRQLIRLYIQAEFSVEEANDGPACLRSLSGSEPELVLLDVMMPKLDGWETLKSIRATSSVPVIMLTARGEVSDRIQGLRLGADDYIPKPFDGRELLARMHAVLRRVNPISAGQQVIARGALVISVLERRAAWQGQTLDLTPKEFDLLTFMASHPGQAVTRERLVDQLWGLEFTGDVRTVDSHVKNLRESLGAGGAMIETVWGVGYRFTPMK